LITIVAENKPNDIFSSDYTRHVLNNPRFSFTTVRFSFVNFVLCLRIAVFNKCVGSTSLYHSRQSCIVLKPRSDGIDDTAVCFMTHECSRKLRNCRPTSWSWISFNGESNVLLGRLRTWIPL